MSADYYQCPFCQDGELIGEPAEGHTKFACPHCAPSTPQAGATPIPDYAPVEERARTCLHLLEAAGMGAPGNPNTLVAMTQEVILRLAQAISLGSSAEECLARTLKERDKALAELAEARLDTERVEWIALNFPNLGKAWTICTREIGGAPKEFLLVDCDRDFFEQVGGTWCSSFRAAIDRAREQQP